MRSVMVSIGDFDSSGSGSNPDASTKHYHDVGSSPTPDPGRVIPGIFLKLNESITMSEHDQMLKKIVEAKDRLYGIWPGKKNKD